jgi:hypothetical protein
LYLRIDTIVEYLGSHKEDHVPDTYPDEGGVASSVQRLVRFPIDLRRDDIRSLYRHVVERRGHGTCAHCTSISTCTGNKDGMYIGIAYD